MKLHYSRRLFRNLLATVLLVWTGTCAAASSTVLGVSSAEQCFNESRLLIPGGDVDPCSQAIASGNLNVRDLAATYSNRGIIYVGNGDYEHAFADYNKAIKLMPTMGEVYINRANVYLHRQDYIKAVADYDQAIKLSGQPLVTAWYNKALALINMKRFDDAEVALQEALKLSPNADKIKTLLSELQDSRSGS